MKHRTEISFATDRSMVIGGQGGAENGTYEHPARPYVWCISCGDHVRPLTTDEAAIQAHVTPLTIFHWVESDLLHYIESSDGLLLICPHSLKAAS